MPKPTLNSPIDNYHKGSYSADVCGTISANLEGLQGFNVMVLELLQNADDARADRIIFDVNDESLVVRNNGQFTSCGKAVSSRCDWSGQEDGRDTCDFHGIMKIASRGKARHPENIGRFGVGFVSVYTSSTGKRWAR